MNTDEDHKLLKEGIEWSIESNRPKGGQLAGLPTPTTILKHKDLGFEIKIDYHRSMHKNRELCEMLFDLFLMEVVK